MVSSGKNSLANSSGSSLEQGVPIVRQNRPAYALIDTQAVQHNLAKTKHYLAQGCHLMAVIKADAYGHGMVTVAQALVSQLAPEDELAVNSLDDVHQLRAAGIDRTITVLSAQLNSDELALCAELNVRPVIYNAQQLANYQQMTNPTPLSVWLKVDTGMGRLGFLANELPEIVRDIDEISSINDISLMTHMANADDKPHRLNQQQLSQFDQIIEGLSKQYSFKQTSIFNSAGIINFSDASLAKQHNIARPGLMLYGISPVVMQEAIQAATQTGISTAQQLDLRAVMTFKSQLISIKRMTKGAPIGYGSTFICPEDMLVGTVACGYGDGYPRHAKQGTPVLINGQQAPLVGRVSMDMITVDLRDLTANIGDEVTLWGEGLPVEIIADCADTIAYELTCGITSRVQKIVT